MNLNEFVMNRKIKPKVTAGDQKIIRKPPSGRGKKHSTCSSDTNWGRSHVSVPNSSNSKKSTGSSKLSSEEADSRVIVALTEGRGEARYEVGIAAISVSMPLLILCQISDTQNYINTITKINIFNPNEILLPNTILDHFAGSRLIDKLKQRFPHVKFIGVPRSTYSKASGLEILNHLCISNLNGILLVLQHRYYALAASSALLTYIQDSLFVYYAGGSIKIDYQESEGYTIIDVSTADRLELVCSTRPTQGNRYSSLFGVLNHCQTKIGARTLRSIILQPPCDVDHITKRLNCVDELVEHPEVLLSIQVLLQKMSNIDSVLSIGTLVSNDPQKYSIRQLNYILLLNSLLDLISPLKEVICGLSQPFFIQLRKTLEDASFTDIKNVVRKTVQENAYSSKGQSAPLQRCFAIKPDINGLLDLVRKTYTERMYDMKDYVKALADKYDLALTLGNNQMRGHHIVLNLSNVQRKGLKKSDIPEEFIEIHRSAGCFTMKTPELVNLSTRLDDIMKDILKISNVMIHSVIVDIKKHIYLFYTLCEEIAQLDVLQSLANASVIRGYTRPVFGGRTEIISSQHPLLDFLLPSKPVSNCVACSDDYNIHIVTGPNGSGKSIFIRQVLLLQVMAQLGCYVPAQSAILKPADRIFARIYLEDNMEYGASSFILEMKEMKYIMTTMTDNSLVVIDELGRSTSLEEGTALAFAVLEKLANTSAYIYITSHFTLLAKLHDLYPNVKLWQMETVSEGINPKLFKLEYKYILLSGVTSVGRYGSYLVRNIWSDDILNFVDNLMDELSKQHTDMNLLALDQKCRLKYDVQSEFRKLKSEKKLSVNKINEILDKYSLDLHELGYSIDFCKLPKIKQFLQEEVATDLKVINCTQDDNDICEVEERIEIFTPEMLINESKLSQYVNDIQGIHSEVSRYSDHSSISPNSFSFDPFIKSPESMIRNPPVNLPLKSISSDNEQKPSQRKRRQSGILKNTNRLSSSWQMSEDDLRASTSTAQYLNAVCIYSPSSGNHSENSSHCSDHVNVSLKSVGYSEHAPKNFSTHGYENMSFSERDYCESNETPAESNSLKYKDYVSPIVEVVEGVNNTTLSWEEDRPSENQNSNKINIIADITIGTACKSVPMNLELNNGIYSKNSTVCFGGETQNCTSNDDSNNSSNIQWLAPDNNRNMFKADCDKIPKITSLNTPDTSITMSFSGEIQNQNENHYEKSKEFMSDLTEYQITKTREINLTPTSKSSITVDHSEKEMDDCFDANAIGADVLGTDINTMLNTSIVKNLAKNTVIYSGCNEVISEKQSSSTSISSASKKRNLDQASSESANKSNDTSLYKKGNEQFNKVEYFGQNEITIEQISLGLNDIGDVCSKSNESTSCTEENSDYQVKRSPFLNVVNNENVRIVSDTVKYVNETGSKRHYLALPSIASALNKHSDQTFTGSISKITENGSDEIKLKQFENNHENGWLGNISKKRKMAKDKFIPPKKLSAKEIRREFEEQDRRILECYPNPPNISKYLEQIINRPTIKQIQNSTQLVLIRKHNDGLQVIPAKTQMKRRRYSLSKRHYSNEDFNMSIFSDKNAKPFEEYLNSNERDYNTFRSNRNNLGDNFITNSFSKETCTFASLKRTTKDSKFEICKIKDDDIEKYSTNQYIDPKVLLEENDINIIINKYLKGNTSSSSFEFSDQIDDEKNNIFDFHNLSNEDLLL